MSEKPSRSLKADIRNLETILFSKDPFIIPPYQRPYKWSIQNVNQLIDDVLLHNDKLAYRLGTVVIHKNGSLNIVDGQQRLYTLSLIAAELLRTEVGSRLIDYTPDELCLAQSAITHPVSLGNLKRNHQHIRNRIREFDRDDILFFFQKCEVVYIELADISEAFQFFDSQNTRGKDLAPHDLLKAFHLREMATNTEAERVACVTYWEEASEQLPHFFSNYLFKIRRWSKGQSGLYFSKKHVDTFKGITIEASADQFTYIHSYRINHYFVDNYNRDSIRKIDSQKMEYPFQLDQVIINGKRFFEYIHHYSTAIHQVENIYKGNFKSNLLSGETDTESIMSRRILHILRTYQGRDRQGDLYVRNLFNCCLLYYWDKFGTYKSDEALIQFFLWAFALRLGKQAVQELSVDNLATESTGFIRLIRETSHPKDLIHKPLKSVFYVGDSKAVSNISALVDIFRDLRAIQN